MDNRLDRAERFLRKCVVAAFQRRWNSRGSRGTDIIVHRSGHNQVRITGVAQIVDDQQLLEEIWNANPLLRQYLGNIDNPEFIVYRIDPRRVRYMREWALEYHDVPLE